MNNIFLNSLQIIIVIIIFWDFNLPAQSEQNNQLTLCDKCVGIFSNDVQSYHVALQKADSIKFLSFSRFPLKHIPKDINNFINLEYLDLNECKIEELPALIGKLKNLKCLNLSGNKLKRLPDEIGKCEKLEYLYLSNNQLKYIPDSMAKLKQLKLLALNGNEFEKLPIVVTKMKNLISLDISNNMIRILSDSIAYLKGLNELLISSNGLKYMPLRVYELSRLVTLDISDNKITTLSYRISSMEHLKYLDISNNPISNLPVSINELKNVEIFLLKTDVNVDDYKNLNKGIYLINDEYNRCEKLKYLFSGGTPKIILLEFKVLEDQCYDSLPTPLTSIEDEIMYPYIAYKAGVEGKIVFRFDITTKGELENLKILKGIGAFIDEEIVATFKNIRFKPAYYKGKAVASKIQMALLFKIED